MRLLFRKFPLLILSLLTISGITAAQVSNQCPNLVQSALAAVDENCASIGRNQVCYGNVILEATPHQNAANFEFAVPGDLVDVADVERLKLESMNAEENIWGVALMKLQANLPDTIPGENVTLLMFGDVEIQDAAAVEPSTAQANSTANIDSQSPMQAFYFRSGIGQPICSEAPEDGILIQTPEGMGKISLSINEVEIVLGSTVYLQAEPDDEMNIYVIEGEAEISAQGVTVTAPAGTIVEIPLDENLAASGPPEEPSGYDEDQLQALPINRLPLQITIAPALEDEAQAGTENTSNLKDRCEAEASASVDAGGGGVSEECCNWYREGGAARGPLMFMGCEA